MAATAAASVLPTVAQQADAKALRYGEHLSQEFTSCHRRDGVANGIHSILGMKADEFVQMMGCYQSGDRKALAA